MLFCFEVKIDIQLFVTNSSIYDKVPPFNFLSYYLFFLLKQAIN